MRFSEWKSGRVFISDARKVDLEGYYNHPEPAPVYAFMHKRPDGKYDQFGVIDVHTARPGDRPQYSVCVENMEPVFDDLEKATEWLWHMHVRHEFPEPEPMQRYRVMYFTPDGKTNRDREVLGDGGIKRFVDELIDRDDDHPDDPNNSYHDEALVALKTVGSRFFEFVGGHIVAIPIDE